jgi:hypothetical protein
MRGWGRGGGGGLVVYYYRGAIILLGEDPLQDQEKKESPKIKADSALVVGARHNT